MQADFTQPSPLKSFVDLECMQRGAVSISPMSQQWLTLEQQKGDGPIIGQQNKSCNCGMTLPWKSVQRGFDRTAESNLFGMNPDLMQLHALLGCQEIVGTEAGVHAQVLLRCNGKSEAKDSDV